MSDSKEIVGIIGSGSFGVTLTKLLYPNAYPILYSRRFKTVADLNTFHANLNYDLPDDVEISNDLEYVAAKCKIIFPVIPSSSFREMMKSLSPYLNPSHILIHCTKGFDYTYKESGEENIVSKIHRSQVKTMSEVIKDESTVIRIGCMAGPNLAKEILADKPAATVIASEFKEVVDLGIRLLSSERFFVFGSEDLKGAEIAGAYKNIIALGSGLLGGIEMGTNAQAMVITRGLHEMIRFGQYFGTDGKAFLGTAGIGDLVATATSQKSRNYTFGQRLAQGEMLEDIISTSREVVEGLRTLKIVKNLAQHYNLKLPITNMLYAIVYEGFDLRKAIGLLMKYPFKKDVDFI